jgi:putative ABC transport system permease protein
LHDTLTLDIRYALRQAWNNRGATLAAFIALAIGIGATTAMFTVVSGVLLRPLPIKDADRIVRLDEINSRTGGKLKVSMSDFLDWKNQVRSFALLAIYRLSQGNFAGTRSPQRVRTLECNTTMLPVLGVVPVRGRNFSPEQDKPGRASEALLTWSFWQSEFGGQDVLGRQLVIDEKPYTIVGVLPNLLMLFGEENVWLPLSLDLSKRENGRGYHWYFVLGRLQQGVTLQQANNELIRLAASLALQYPTRNEVVSARVNDFRETVTGEYKPALLLLFGFVASVLLIACGNVASLALARASNRQREISIRVAVGASGFRLFRQMLTESILLSSAATVAGCGIAFLLVHVLIRLQLNIPLVQNIQIDWRVLLFSAAVAFLTGILFGLAPALRSLLVQPADALKQSSARTTESRSQQNIKRSFVFLQSAMATLLLLVCSLLLRSFVKASEINPGFDVNHLLTLHVSLPPSRLDFEHPGKIGLFASNVLARIRAIPGIEDATIASDLPLAAPGGGAGVLVEGNQHSTSPFSAPYAQWTLVSPGYFSTLKIPLLRGRDFNERDRQGTPSVAIVNQAFVKHFLGGQNAVTKRIALATDPSHYLQIVGVVGDVRQLGLEKETLPELFSSLNQIEDAWLTIIARTHGQPVQYVTPIRRAVEKVDPSIAVFLPRTMEQIISEQRNWRALGTSLVGAFAAIAILLAAQGTYALISYSVSQRAAEIGIRMALGATEKNILENFTLQGAMPAILGSVLGVVLGFGVAVLGATLLYGVGPTDFMSYAAAALILMAVAFAASYLPARRAALLDPSRALRYE